MRISNTYGSRMLVDDRRVVCNFIVQVLQGKDLTVYGDGAQTRSFCYVDDLIEGFVRLMNHPSINGRRPETTPALHLTGKKRTGLDATIAYFRKL